MRRKGIDITMIYRCPSCGYFTIDSDDEKVVEICDVCHWQYDSTAHKYPDRVIGPNSVSLNQAIQNYREFKACERKFIGRAREPFPEEYPSENLAV